MKKVIRNATVALVITAGITAGTTGIAAASTAENTTHHTAASSIPAEQTEQTPAGETLHQVKKIVADVKPVNGWQVNGWQVNGWQ
ncbi:hypothetical protein ACQEVX_18290 [Streptomyces syringium]|uniref:hypothetical protein n=1 Tax=Streptomyces syringium TaxID=76729 RepID=UPI003D93A33D